MAIAQAAQRAVLALGGGHSDTFPGQSSAEVAAVYAVCKSQSNNTGTEVYRYALDFTTLTIGRENIPGQQDLTTKYTFDTPGVYTTGTFDGLQRR